MKDRISGTVVAVALLGMWHVCVALGAPCLLAPEVATFTAASPLPYGSFGNSVAIDDDIIVVGDRWYDGDRGMAQVYELVNGQWTLAAELSLGLGKQLYKLGYSVAVDDGTIVVSAPYGQFNAQGYDGVAVVYQKVNGIWQEVQRLTRPDDEPWTLFGSSVAVSGDTVIVGAMYDDEDGDNNGAAFVYRRVDGVFTFSQKLTVGITSIFRSFFGYSVSIDGDIAVVGAPFSDVDGADSGAAFVFRETAGVFQQEYRLRSTGVTTGSEFGASVAVDGERVIVGARTQRTTRPYSGAAFIFERQGATWIQASELVPQDADAGSWYGYSVALDADIAVVGNPNARSGYQSTGAAYVFRRIIGQWAYLGRLSVTDQSPSAELGNAVDVQGGVIVAGDPYTSLSGEQGVVYAYEVPASSLRADLNDDGFVDVMDLTSFVDVLLGQDSDAFHALRSDVDCSGVVDGNDVQAFVMSYLF